MKKTILTICALTLITTLTSVVYQNWPLTAALESTTYQVSSYSFTDSGVFSEDARIDTDQEGNKITVWSYSNYDATQSSYCNGIRFQRLNQTDLPLIMPRTVSETCAGSTPTTYARHPEIAVDNYGNFIVVWEEINKSISPYSVLVKAALYDNLNLQKSTFIVNQGSNYTSANGTGPSIAINKSSAETAENFAISWFNCTDRSNFCATLTNSSTIESRVYEVNFASTTPIATLQNFATINQDRTNNYPVPQKPGISFSANNYLITWNAHDGTDALNSNEAVWGRLVQTTGLAPENIFRISELNQHSENSDVAGTIRVMPSPETTNVNDVFYVTWNATPQTTKNIYMRKVLCDSSLLCSTSARTTYNNNTPSSELITIKVNNSSNSISAPHISLWQNTNDARKVYGYENSASDQVFISWSDTDSISGNSIIYGQMFNYNMSRIGEQLIIQNDLVGSVPSDHSVNQDGLYSILYSNSSNLELRTINRDQFKYGEETLIHSSDRLNVQTNPAVAINDNAYTVMVYQNFNGTDNDIVFSLFDDNGLAVVNTTIANSTTNLNQINPSVSFFNDLSTSPNYGKFIISWSGNGNGDSNGIYYRLFNADGTPDGDEVLVNQNVSDPQERPSVSAGSYPEFAIAYLEKSASNHAVKLFYHGNSTNIYSEAGTSGASDYLKNPRVSLNPKAQSGTLDYSQFAVLYENSENNTTVIRDGNLVTANDISWINTKTINGYNADISGTYVEGLQNVLVSPIGGIHRNPFYYAVSYIDSADLQTKVNTYTFDQNVMHNAKIISNTAGENNLSTRLSIDPATGNILVSWLAMSDFGSAIDNTKIAFPDTPNIFNTNDYLFDLDYHESVLISYGNNYPSYFILKPRNAGVGITTADDLVKMYYANVASAGSVNAGLQSIQLVTGSGVKPKAGQLLFTLSGDGSGQVSSVTDNDNFVASVSAPFVTGEDIALGTRVNSISGGNILNVDLGIGNSYIVGEKLFGLNMDFGTGSFGPDKATGTITNISADGSQITISQDASDLGSFTNITLIANYSAKFNPNSSYLVSFLKGQFLRLRIDGEFANLDSFGPNIMMNKYPFYNEGIDTPAISYDTRPATNTKKYAIALYSVNASPDSPYVDQTGVYRQVFSDPFSLGTIGSIYSSAFQQINPGGKYIIVPSLIDFGDVTKGGTSIVNFRDFPSNGYLEIADLDGTPFDLTVTMSDLSNGSGGTIAKSQVAIFNYDNAPGAPEVTTNYAFTDVNDLILDPSSDPQDTSQRELIQSYLTNPVTLLRKNNSNTGIYQIHPQVVLFSNPTDQSGVYSGTMTFTLN